MITVVFSPTHAGASRRWPAVRLLGLLSLAFSSSCRSTADFVEAARPTTRSSLELRMRPALGDTIRAELLLGVGPTTVISSLSAVLEVPSGLHFVSCRAEQGAPLIACGDGPDGLRFASSWATGAHTGALVSFVFVQGSTESSQPWKLKVNDIFGATGTSLLDSLDVNDGNAP
jgi:hypothetical protein